eukprot:s452_g19.t1
MPLELNEDVWRTLYKRVALFDFEPTSLTDWPFTRQKPLAFKTGQVVEVVYDDGSDWLLGHLASLPEMVGYFPKDYVVSVEEYEIQPEIRESSAKAPRKLRESQSRASKAGAPKSMTDGKGIRDVAGHQGRCRTPGTFLDVRDVEEVRDVAGRQGRCRTSFLRSSRRTKSRRRDRKRSSRIPAIR